ncbi:diphthamide biosynthesis protein 4 [Phyllosticta citribraziliensis]|uniref:Diphthamide biosynthesis protein 4 n=1 Tax=Phyllosticta citribraziliensis TaxID=989973 RepID=A0ABR1M4L2_9PEZI
MAPASTVLPASFNAYRILSLPSPRQTASRPPSPADIKAAYRRALLTHHPDKAAGALNGNGVDADARSNGARNMTKAAGSSTPAFSVDDITLAYKTLSSPAERAAHDRALRLSNNGDGKGKDGGPETHAEEQFRLGLEAWDLDELAWDEAQGVWWRGCRCGEERGFVVREGDLERALEGVAGPGGAGAGEVLVGCCGCSLWVRVGFAVEEEEEG